MAPSQENPQRANYGLSIFQTNPTDTGDIVDSALGQLTEAEVLVDEISPVSPREHVAGIRVE